MIKAVIFDMDHTLYDRDGTYRNMGESFCNVFKDYINHDKTREELVQILQQSDKEGAYCGWEGIYEKVCEYRAFRTPPSFEMFYGYIFDRFSECIEPYEDTYEILEWCKASGYQTGIITNGTEDFQMKKIKALQLDRHVEHIIIGGVIGSQKPDLKPFYAMSSLLQLKPSEMVYVGDNPLNDIDASRRAGFIPIWFRSVGIWLESVERTAYCIDRLKEIPAVIAAIREREDCLK